jgi:hypothetical protein
MTRTSTLALITLAILTGLALTGCGASIGGGAATAAPAILNSIQVSPASASAPLGRGQQFTATGNYSDGTSRDLTNAVSWSSLATAVATVSATGAASSAGVGTTTITATSGTVTGSASFTVTAAALVSLVVNPQNSSLAIGSSEQLSAIGTFTDGSTQDLSNSVTWSVLPAGVVTVSGSGMATGQSSGAANVVAILGSISGSASVNVTGSGLVSIAVTPFAPSIVQGAGQQFTATGKFSDGSTQVLTNVTWNSTVSSVATINGSGLATGTGPGSTTIAASSGGVSGSTTLTVTAATLVSINVLPGSASVAAGATQQFSANGIFSDGSSRDLTNSVSWSSSASTIASVANSGLATGVAAGDATISASSGAVTGSATLTVTPATLVGINVFPDSSMLPVGVNQQFTATGTFSDGSTQNLASVSWSSSDGTLASISDTGMLSALAPGTVTITASTGGITGSTTLTIISAVLTSIAITPTNSSIPLGTGQQFTATGVFSDGSTQDLPSVNWSSSSPFVAVIDGASGFAVSAGLGSTTITATSGSVSSSTTLMVTAATLVSIAVAPAVPNIGIGGLQQFTAVGTFTDGSTQDISDVASWSSSVASVATISSTGLAMGWSSGTSVIAATFSGATGSTTLTVSTATLVSISILPATPRMAPHTRMQLAAVGNFSDGSTEVLTTVVHWSSQRPSLGSVSGTGVVRAKHNGTTTLNAQYGNLTGSTTLTVSNATLVSLAVNPATASIAAGTKQQFTVTGNFSDGGTEDLTATVHWSSSKGSVATVSNSLSSDGLATAVATGTATVSASYAGLSGSAALTVTGAKLVFIAVAPANPVIALGRTQQFAATGSFDDNTTQDISNSVTWSSSVAGVAIINNLGLATSTGTGSTTIAASSAGVSGTSTLAVQ